MLKATCGRLTHEIQCSVRYAHDSKANCGWLRPCNIAVIPAEAGIQALNDQKPPEGGF